MQGMPEPCEIAARHFEEVLSALAPDTVEAWLAKQGGNSAKAWHMCMVEGLDVKKARYAKSVTRIIGQPADRYHAVDYCDFESMCEAAVITELCVRQPQEEAEKRRFWKLMKMASRNAQEAMEYQPTKTPTPKEIEENIQQHRTRRRPLRASSTPLSMNRAFHEALIRLAETLKVDAAATRFRAYTAEQIRDASAAWSKALEGGIDDSIRAKNLSAMKDFEWPEFLEAEKELVRAFVEKSESNGDASAMWNQLESIASFSKVQSAIPSDMMSKIEAQAQKLSEALTNGGSLEDLDLTKIGESVLSECTEEDMQKVASQIGTLLPTLTSLQKTMPSGINGAAGMAAAGLDASNLAG